MVLRAQRAGPVKEGGGFGYVVERLPGGAAGVLGRTRTSRPCRRSRTPSAYLSDRRAFGAPLDRAPGDPAHARAGYAPPSSRRCASSATRPPGRIHEGEDATREVSMCSSRGRDRRTAPPTRRCSSTAGATATVEECPIARYYRDVAALRDRRRRVRSDARNHLETDVRRGGVRPPFTPRESAANAAITTQGDNDD